VMMLTVGAGFFTFLVLITMTLSDYISRNWGLW
jgi:cytochrome c oxidase subunit 4